MLGYTYKRKIYHPKNEIVTNAEGNETNMSAYSLMKMNNIIYEN